MAQQLNELEQHIGYSFNNQGYLRCALTYQRVTDERQPDGTGQSFQALQLVGDSVIKYSIATLLCIEQNSLSSRGDLHTKVAPHISNFNLSRIGKELNLSEFIIKGKDVFEPTDKMLADTVEAILGAIVIDQQQQGNNADNVVLDVVAHLWSIKRKGQRMTMPPAQPSDNKDKCCSCCTCECWKVFAVIVVFASIIIAILVYTKAGGDL
jgi:dsRNA-specific ribonuclease